MRSICLSCSLDKSFEGLPDEETEIGGITLCPQLWTLEVSRSSTTGCRPRAQHHGGATRDFLPGVESGTDSTVRPVSGGEGPEDTSSPESPSWDHAAGGQSEDGLALACPARRVPGPPPCHPLPESGEDWQAPLPAGETSLAGFWGQLCC